MNEEVKLKIEKVDINDRSLIILGKFLKEEVKALFFKDDKGNKYDVEYIYLKDGVYFKVCIDANNFKYLYPCIEVDNVDYQVGMEFGISSKLNNHFCSLYLSGNHFFVKYSKKNNRFDIYKKSFFNNIKLELKCIYFLFKKRKFKNLFIREWINICNFFKVRDVWLITDRSELANDNGEALFKYVINEELNPDTKYFFALDKKSKDFKRLYYNYSNVININSYKYKLLFLRADIVISSRIDDININPYYEDKIYLGDLYNHKFVYLQHRNNIKKLVCNEMDVDMIITDKNEEFNYYIDNVVDENMVKLTGFPRNDIENSDILNKILILFDEDNPEIYQFYNKLINDEKILSMLREKNYLIRLICNKKYDFDTNGFVSIGYKDIVYNDEIRNSKLLITNNLDLLNDFSYLKRSIIYYSFNKENVDVFGSSCCKYDKLVSEIIKKIKKDCVLEKKYIKKIDKLYEYNDNNNCKRVYDEIKK